MTRSELKELLEEEKQLYFSTDYVYKHYRRYRHNRYKIWRYLRFHRLLTYWKQILDKSSSRIDKSMAKIMIKYCKYTLGTCYAGVEISSDSQLGRCIDIYHGGVVINGTVGDRCVFHGNNILGNKGIGRENEQPILGNDVDVGAGAVIIGAVEIAEGYKVGANAVVVQSCMIPNSVLCGIPAKIKAE